MSFIYKGIPPSIIPPYENEYLQIARSKVPEKYKKLKNYKKIMDSYKPEILNDYDQAMRWYLLRYVLNDPSEWRRLKIETFPVEYPVMMIRAPVPWHTAYVLAQQAIERKYFKGHITLIQIRDLWTEKLVLFPILSSLFRKYFFRFKTMLILPMESLEKEVRFPHDPSYFQQRVAAICTEARRHLLKEWLPLCADILLEHKLAWKQFIPKHPGDTLTNVQRFFGAINALLSKQLRMLVLHSLQHFLKFLERYEVYNRCQLLNLFLPKQIF